MEKKVLSKMDIDREKEFEPVYTNLFNIDIVPREQTDLDELLGKYWKDRFMAFHVSEERIEIGFEENVNSFLQFKILEKVIKDGSILLGDVKTTIHDKKGDVLTVIDLKGVYIVGVDTDVFTYHNDNQPITRLFIICDYTKITFTHSN